MSTEFDPQGRVYWGPHALSFPSAIWFDNSADPVVTLKLNVGGEGSASQYMNLATFDRTDPNSTLTVSGSSEASTPTQTFAGQDGVDVTTSGTDVTFAFDVASLTATQITALQTLIDTDTDTGEVNTASNVGGAEGLFKQKTAQDLEFYSLDGIDGVAINKASDVISLSFDAATLTSQQLADLRASLLPTDATGVLTNDGNGGLSWQLLSASSHSFASANGTITNAGTADALDLDIVADAVAGELATFVSANPSDPAATALGDAITAAGDSSAMHQKLADHYGANPSDLAAMRALLDTDTDTRVVVSFADTDNNGTNDVLRVELFAVDPSTGNTTGAALSTTDMPLSTFASGVIATTTTAPISGDGSTGDPITLSDAALSTALSNPQASAAIGSAAAAGFDWASVSQNQIAAAVGSIVVNTETNMPGFTRLDGTLITNGARTYLVTAGRFPSLVSGNDLALPDMRGQFLRCLDETGTVDPDGASRSLGEAQADAFQGHQHSIAGYVWNGSGSGGSLFPNGGTRPHGSINSLRNGTSELPGFDSPRIATETRPKNIAVNFWLPLA